AELKTLTSKLESIPARIESLKKLTLIARQELEQTRQAVLDRRKQYKLAEVELKTAEDKINGYSVQLYSAKTNEQYKAFLKEIEAQKKLKNTIEDRMIALMEETEALDQKARASERQVAEIEAEHQDKIRLLEAEQAELTSAIEQRLAQRSQIAEQLPPDLLKRYERIKASKSGVAVAPIRKERCSGCLSPIPAQRIVEIDREDRIYICEACGRILVVARD
ncbi:MAG: hypothetical protein ABIK86_07545, partial [candidate division WOR-3 bacterium]